MIRPKLKYLTNENFAIFDLAKISKEKIAKLPELKLHDITSSDIAKNLCSSRNYS